MKRREQVGIMENRFKTQLNPKTVFDVKPVEKKRDLRIVRELYNKRNIIAT